MFLGGMTKKAGEKSSNPPRFDVKYLLPGVSDMHGLHGGTGNTISATGCLKCSNTGFPLFLHVSG
jgi:hypothetical protein